MSVTEPTQPTDGEPPQDDSAAAKELRQIKRILVGALVAAVVGGVGFVMYQDEQEKKREQDKIGDCFTLAIKADNGDLRAREKFYNSDCVD